MLKKYLLLVLTFCALQVQAQVTNVVFSDDFSSPNSTTWDFGVGAAISTSNWKVTNNGNCGARINAGKMEITTRRSSSDHGQGFGNIKCGGTNSFFDNTHYSSVLGNNTGVVTWTFNMRRPTTTTTGSGFSCSSASSQNNITTGLAFILATNSDSGTLSATGDCNPNGTSVGYAVIFGGGSSNNITPKLIRYQNGIHNGTHTDIAAWSAGIAKANYMSVKVTFDPTNNQWTLQVRSDGTSTFADPDAGTYGAAVAGTDATYTAQSLNYMGAYMQSGCIGNCDEAADGYIASYDNVKVKVEAPCSEIPAQPSAIAGDAAPCQGTAQTYSVDADPVATSYTWTLPTGYVGSSTTNTMNVSSVSGSGQISVVAKNACGFSLEQFLSVTSPGAIPAEPYFINAGSTVLCYASSVTYTANTDPNISSYTWTIPSGWSGTSTTNSITAMTDGTGGTVSVIGNNGCGSSTAHSINVTSTVGAGPSQPSAIVGSTVVCSSSTETYSVTSDPDVASYTWTLPPNWTGTSTTNSISVTSDGTNGDISVVATNACGTSIAQVIYVSAGNVPTQPSLIQGVTDLCGVATETYSVTSEPNTTYTWTLPSNWTGTSTTNSISATSDGTGGDISVVAVNSCGTSVPQTVAVTIGSAPIQPSTIVGTTTYCGVTTETYSVTVDPSATSYTWTLPTNWIGISATNDISVTTDGNAGTISVTATNSCGTSIAQTLSVTTGNAPLQPSIIVGETSVCGNAIETYTVTLDPSVTTYEWTLPGNWNGTSTTNSITVTTDGTAGVVSVSATNSCGTSTAQTLSVVAGNAPLQPSIIAGEVSLCGISTESYTVTNDPNATSYTWILPANWTGTSTTNTISVTTDGTAGVISLVANNACGASVAQTLTVSAGTAPDQPGAIQGAISLCSNASQTYTVPTSTNVISYTWTLPANWTGTSTANGILVTPAGNSGTITVVANNACGSSIAQTLSVVMNQATSSTINRSECGSSYSLNGQNYIVSGTYTQTIANNNGCDSVITLNLTLTNSFTASVSRNNLTLSANVIGATYQWLNCDTGNSAISGATSQTYTPTTSGNYAVKITKGACTSTSPCFYFDKTLTITETSEDNSLIVYPNPSTGLFNLTRTSQDAMHLNVYDFSGKVVLSLSESTATEIQLDLSTVANGVYILEIRQENSVNRMKLVKK